MALRAHFGNIFELIRKRFATPPEIASLTSARFDVRRRCIKDEEVLRIIYDNDIKGAKVVPIGRIHAASGWHGHRSVVARDFYKAKALKNLVDVAEDCDADAIIEVDYGVDHADDGDLPGAATLQRVSVSGLAVKLMRV
jgi:uncharacterized protein YbjQ (UPF0145 family)